MAPDEPIVGAEGEGGEDALGLLVVHQARLRIGRNEETTISQFQKYPKSKKMVYFTYRMQ